jgi:glucose-1-phosphate thymidylyltransferase
VILAAGRGSRMRHASAAAGLDPTQRELAARGMKSMIPDTRGRPFLDHLLAALADGGITDLCLVIAPDHALVREHYTRQPPTRLRLAFAVQQEPTGTADGVLAAEPWAGTNDLLVLNADNLYPVEVITALVALDGPGLAAFDRDALVRESNIDPARIGAFAVVTLRADNTLAAIVEKPGDAYDAAAPVPPLISMNIWRFDQRIFDACRSVPLSPRGEHELPLAVGLAVAQGMQLHAVRVAAGVLDLSRQDDVRDVARRLGERELRV